jgi:PAS domain-containing protein
MADILDACPAVLVVVDLAGIIHWSNQAFRGLARRPEGDLVGRPAWDWLPIEVALSAAALSSVPAPRLSLSITPGSRGVWLITSSVQPGAGWRSFGRSSSSRSNRRPSRTRTEKFLCKPVPTITPDERGPRSIESLARYADVNDRLTDRRPRNGSRRCPVQRTGTTRRRRQCRSRE